MRSSDRHAGGYAISLCAAAILGTTGVLIRYLSLTYHLPALVMALWRDIFVVATLVPLLGILRRDRLRVPSALLPYLAIYGLVLALFNVAWTLSVTINGAAIATVLGYCSGAFTVFLGRWILKEPLSLAKLLATVLSLGGCILVSGALHVAAWRVNLAGILAGGFSGLAYAAYSLMGRFASMRGLNPWTTLVYIFGFASVYLLLFNLPPGGFLPGSAAHPADFFWLGASLKGWGILFLLAAGPTVAGFGLYLVSLVRLPSSIANLVVSLEPAFTALFAYILLGERMTGVQVAGGLLILTGVATLRGSEIGRPSDPVRRSPPHGRWFSIYPWRSRGTGAKVARRAR